MPVVFADRLRALHAAAPGAALLVLGPPDALPPPPQGQRRTARLRRSELDRAAEPAPIREAQRSVAAREGAYFWDWQAAMGGPCSMLRWAATSPPMAAPDHVHLYAPGYQATADALFRAIMDGYDRYRALRPAA